MEIGLTEKGVIRVLEIYQQDWDAEKSNLTIDTLNHLLSDATRFEMYEFCVKINLELNSRNI